MKRTQQSGNKFDDAYINEIIDNDDEGGEIKAGRGIVSDQPIKDEKDDLYADFMKDFFKQDRMEEIVDRMEEKEIKNKLDKGDEVIMNEEVIFRRPVPQLGFITKERKLKKVEESDKNLKKVTEVYTSIPIDVRKDEDVSKRVQITRNDKEGLKIKLHDLVKELDKIKEIKKEIDEQKGNRSFEKESRNINISVDQREDDEIDTSSKKKEDKDDNGRKLEIDNLKKVVEVQVSKGKLKPVTVKLDPSLVRQVDVQEKIKMKELQGEILDYSSEIGENFNIDSSQNYDVMVLKNENKELMDKILNMSEKSFKPFNFEQNILIDYYDPYSHKETKSIVKQRLKIESFKDLENLRKRLKDGNMINIEDLSLKERKIENGIDQVMKNKEFLGDVVAYGVSENIPVFFKNFSNVVSGIILNSGDRVIKKFLLTEDKKDFIEQILHSIIGDMYGVKGATFKEMQDNLIIKQEAVKDFMKRKERIKNDFNANQIPDFDDLEYEDDDGFFQNEIFELNLPVLYTFYEGERFTFFGGAIADYGISSYDEGRNFLANLSYHGFIPKEMLPLMDLYLDGTERNEEFKNFIGKYPNAFMNYWLSKETVDKIKNKEIEFKPSQMSKMEKIMNLGIVESNDVTFDEMKRMLNEQNFLNNFKFKTYTPDDIRTIFYVNQTLTKSSNIVLYDTNKWINDFFNKNLDKVEELRTRIVKEKKKIIENPMEFCSKSNKAFELVVGQVGIVNSQGNMQYFEASELAKRIKNIFSADCMDDVTVSILKNTSPYDLSFLKNMFEEYYYGGGTPDMMIKRYHDSLKIFQDSNTEKVQKFREDSYNNNFQNFLEEFGYDIEFLNIDMPVRAIDYENYILENVNGFVEKMVYINPNTKGNFTTYVKRDQTGQEDIQVFLDNFNHYFNGGNELFKNGFKNIAAKTKVEIHNFDKEPRFFNPTILPAYMAFQFVFNIAFSKIKNFTKNNHHNLLGISDDGKNFSDVMYYLFNNDCRMHYSDNFWISEEGWIASVDVKRCDSNLSKICFEKPLLYYGERVLSEKDYKIFKEIVNEFLDSIPHDTFIGINVGKDNILLKSKFYWLPSGVVGTAYFNHLFTGFFLYISREIKWLNNKGELTSNIKTLSQMFGIKLQIASVFKKGYENYKDNDLVPFDLLGRYGMLIEKEFIPLLEPRRMWLSLLFLKTSTKNKGPIISLLIRMMKAEAVLDHGGCLIPEVFQFCLSILIVTVTYLRQAFLKISSEAREKIFKELMEYKLDPVNIYNILYHVPRIDPTLYIYQKTNQFLPLPSGIREMLENVNARKEEVIQFKILLGDIFEENRKFKERYMSENKINKKDQESILNKNGYENFIKAKRAMNEELIGSNMTEEFINEIMFINRNNKSRFDKDFESNKDVPYFHFYASSIKPYLGKNYLFLLTLIVRDIWNHRNNKVLRGNTNFRNYLVKDLTRRVNKLISEEKLTKSKGKELMKSYVDKIDNLESTKINVAQNFKNNGKFLLFINIEGEKALTAAVNKIPWNEIYPMFSYNIFNLTNVRKEDFNKLIASSVLRYYYGLGLKSIVNLIDEFKNTNVKILFNRKKLNIPENYSEIIGLYDRLYKLSVKKLGLPGRNENCYDKVFELCDYSKNRDKMNEFFLQNTNE